MTRLISASACAADGVNIPVALEAVIGEAKIVC